MPNDFILDAEDVFLDDTAEDIECAMDDVFDSDGSDIDRIADISCDIENDDENDDLYSYEDDEDAKDGMYVDYEVPDQTEYIDLDELDDDEDDDDEDDDEEDVIYYED